MLVDWVCRCVGYLLALEESFAMRLAWVLCPLLIMFGMACHAGYAPSGAELFARYCAVCHGEHGDGHSRAQGSMTPPPRDFTSPQAALELNRERMLHSVTEGRPGTAMAAWKNQLSSEQIAAVVDYIRATLLRPLATGGEDEGGRLYAENCAVCHGDDGRGAVWTLTNLKPPPRNFTLPGTAAQLSRDYMRQVVGYGKADTAMPGFASQLSTGQIAAVVGFVRRTFMGVNSQETPQDAAAVAAIDMRAALPGGLVGDSARGQAYYLQNCVACHGGNGDGKGPRAYFILPKPRNFRHPGARHSLNRPRLFQAIAQGSRGTDMPAWRQVLNAQQIADLAEYLYQAFISGEPETAQSPAADKG